MSPIDPRWLTTSPPLAVDGDDRHSEPSPPAPERTPPVTPPPDPDLDEAARGSGQD